ncbi:unnamed protein product [Somion occarium]|uniref:Fungal-type protein kinase domain-containing protein n=1 Tax=Somion occarium TaxID=3059160 RepID=A0ABP1DL93_9APHY
MPITEAGGFFDAFMTPQADKWLQKKIPTLNVDKVPCEPKHESTMYGPLCAAVNDSEVCPGFKLVNVASMVDGNGRKLRPDIALVEKGKLAYNFGNIDTFSEIKNLVTKDPFYRKADLNTLEKDEGDSADTRGQLLSYVTTMLSRQQRTFILSFSICGSYVRFFRWDRAGCVVTELINFHKNPEILAEFFWRYSHLTPAQRGFDTTAVLATARESTMLSKALNAYIRDSKPRDVSYLRPERDPTYPTYKIAVDFGEKTPRKFIIRQPFWDAQSPCGRATRAYAAYDISEGKLVFLKDSWRVEDEEEPGIRCEAEIYEDLKECGVPFLPNVIHAGDVKVGGEIQKTRCQEDSGNDHPEWRKPCDRLHALVHYRVIQELVYPLSSAVSSNEAVQGVRDAAEAIKVSYKKGKIFHRDISTGNIMIDKDGRGVLNDWDHAMKLLIGGSHSYRTGTWQFISIRLLSDPYKRHEVHDDLESCFWVLLYHALHYFEHNQPKVRPIFFDEMNPVEQDDGDLQAIGGGGKIAMLTVQLHTYKWTCQPLDTLIHKLGSIFDEYNRMIINPHADKVAFSSLQNAIDDVDIILNLFDTALASDGWLDKDARPDMFPRRTKAELDRENARKQMDAIEKATQSRAPRNHTGGPAKTTPSPLRQGHVPVSKNVYSLNTSGEARFKPSPLARTTPSPLSRTHVAIDEGEVQDPHEVPDPRTGPSRHAIGVFRSSSKRTIDDAREGEPCFPSSKKIRTEERDRPPPRSRPRPRRVPPPAPPPPAPPVPAAAEPRYLTRSKTKLKKSAQDDVDMREVSHRYETRSKSNESRRQQNSGAQATKKKVERMPFRTKGIKSAGAVGNRVQPKLNPHRRR